MTRAEERHQEHMGLLEAIAGHLATIAENTAPQAPEDDAAPTTLLDKLRALVGPTDDAEDDSELHEEGPAPHTGTPEDITALVQNDPEWRAWFEDLAKRVWKMGPITRPVPVPPIIWDPPRPEEPSPSRGNGTGALDTRLYPTRVVAIAQQAIRRAQPEYRDGQDVTAAYELLDALSDAGAHLHDSTPSRTDGARPWTT